MPNPNNNPYSHLKPVEMHICQNDGCGSELVQPIRWSQLDDKQQWSFELFCSNCVTFSAGVFSKEDVEAFEEKFDIGMNALQKSLKLLAESNMSDEIDVFVDALNADAIWPEDFGRI